MICKRAIAKIRQLKVSDFLQQRWSSFSTLMFGYDHMKSQNVKWKIDEIASPCECWSCSSILQLDETSSKALGTLLHQGVVLPQDYELARKLYLHAFDRGIAAAGNSLGFMSQHGHGVALSDACAMEWYDKAAQQGCATAQYNMGCIYFHSAWNADTHKVIFNDHSVCSRDA
jgi:TPR repeat protein